MKKSRTKRPYEFGDVPAGALAGLSINFYESDYGRTRLLGAPIYKALGAHKLLKRPRGARKCRVTCGPCAAEPAFNRFLAVVFAAGGLVQSISEDW